MTAQPILPDNITPQHAYLNACKAAEALGKISVLNIGWKSYTIIIIISGKKAQVMYFNEI